MTQDGKTQGLTQQIFCWLNFSPKCSLLIAMKGATQKTSLVHQLLQGWLKFEMLWVKIPKYCSSQVGAEGESKFSMSGQNSFDMV